MNTNLEKFYDDDFYNEQVEGSISSAKIIIGRLLELYQPLSVVDFGCGMGSWLKEAEARGCRVLKGFDGNWVKSESLLSENIDFTAVDMSKNIQLGTRYDLAISLEVAEHLPEDSANDFVSTLCRASDIILFGAAIKDQGGINHINEQWQSYWIRLFDQQGYECFDIFRGALWDNKKISWWYKQNTFLFVKKGSGDMALDQKILKSMKISITDAVHPDNYANKVKQLHESKILASTYRDKYRHEVASIKNPPSLRFCLGIIKRYFLSRLGVSTNN